MRPALGVHGHEGQHHPQPRFEVLLAQPLDECDRQARARDTRHGTETTNRVSAAPVGEAVRSRGGDLAQ